MNSILGILLYGPETWMLRCLDWTIQLKKHNFSLSFTPDITPDRKVRQTSRTGVDLHLTVPQIVKVCSVSCFPENQSSPVYIFRCQTHGKFGDFGLGAVEAQHDDLQAVTAVCPFEEARLQQVWREARGQIYPPVRQAITETRKHMFKTHLAPDHKTETRKWNC